jgi:hypothetical protein
VPGKLLRIEPSMLGVRFEDGGDLPSATLVASKRPPSGTGRNTVPL